MKLYAWISCGGALLVAATLAQGLQVRVKDSSTCVDFATAIATRRTCANGAYLQHFSYDKTTQQLRIHAYPAECWTIVMGNMVSRKNCDSLNPNQRFVFRQSGASNYVIMQPPNDPMSCFDGQDISPKMARCDAAYTATRDSQVFEILGSLIDEMVTPVPNLVPAVDPAPTQAPALVPASAFGDCEDVSSAL